MGGISRRPLEPFRVPMTSRPLGFHAARSGLGDRGWGDSMASPGVRSLRQDRLRVEVFEQFLVAPIVEDAVEREAVKYIQ